MDFTRQPIVETVITPKEGCKLVVRSSKSVGQEEYFVDSLEVVSFGSALFYRSSEKPKAFLVPVSDYEVIQVRETRMVLKTASSDKTAVKIGGGKAIKEEKKEESESSEKRSDKKRRRSGRRRRRGEQRDLENDNGDEGEEEVNIVDEESGEAPELSPASETEQEAAKELEGRSGGQILSSLLPPPPGLISDSIHRYRDDDLFKGAFFDEDEEEQPASEAEEPSDWTPDLEHPEQQTPPPLPTEVAAEEPSDEQETSVEVHSEKE